VSKARIPWVSRGDETGGVEREGVAVVLMVERGGTEDEGWEDGREWGPPSVGECVGNRLLARGKRAGG
jgi:hypothetical protein